MCHTQKDACRYERPDPDSHAQCSSIIECLVAGQPPQLWSGDERAIRASDNFFLWGDQNLKYGREAENIVLKTDFLPLDLVKKAMTYTHFTPLPFPPCLPLLGHWPVFATSPLHPLCPESQAGQMRDVSKPHQFHSDTVKCQHQGLN